MESRTSRTGQARQAQAPSRSGDKNTTLPADQQSCLGALLASLCGGRGGAAVSDATPATANTTSPSPSAPAKPVASTSASKKSTNSASVAAAVSLSPPRAAQNNTWVSVAAPSPATPVISAVQSSLFESSSSSSRSSERNSPTSAASADRALAVPEISLAPPSPSVTPSNSFSPPRSPISTSPRPVSPAIVSPSSSSIASTSVAPAAGASLPAVPAAVATTSTSSTALTSALVSLPLPAASAVIASTTITASSSAAVITNVDDASAVASTAPYLLTVVAGRRTSVARSRASADEVVRALLQQHRGTSPAFLIESLAARTDRGISLKQLTGYTSSSSSSSNADKLLRVPDSAASASASSPSTLPASPSQRPSSIPRSPSWSSIPLLPSSLLTGAEAPTTEGGSSPVAAATVSKSTPKPTAEQRVRALRALAALIAARSPLSSSSSSSSSSPSSSERHRPPLSAAHLDALKFALRTLALDNAESERRAARDFITRIDASSFALLDRSGAYDCANADDDVTRALALAMRVADAAEHAANQRIMHALHHIDRWSFDIFALEESAAGAPLVYMVFRLCHRYDLISRLHLDVGTLFRFACGIETGYKAHNPYHNATHAADVAQSVHFFLSVVQLAPHMSASEIFCIIIAAALHDFRHPGVTERFCTDTQHELALLYNDVYVMESFHAAASFQLMLGDAAVDVLAHLPARQRQQMKAQIIQLILATNLTDHFTFVKTFNRMLGEQRDAGVAGQITAANKHLVMQCIVKCADVSNPAKPFDLYAEWTARIMEEFYLQGDVERAIGLPVSRFMDRETPEVAACQIGFIDFIVAPLYKAIGEFSPAVRAQCTPLIESNRAQWAHVQQRYPVAAVAPVPPTPPLWSGISRPALATGGVRAFPSTALPNRIFGEGRSPIYDYSYLADEYGAWYARPTQQTAPAAGGMRRLSTISQQIGVSRRQSVAAPLTGTAADERASSSSNSTALAAVVASRAGSEQPSPFRRQSTLGDVNPLTLTATHAKNAGKASHRSAPALHEE